MEKITEKITNFLLFLLKLVEIYPIAIPGGILFLLLFTVFYYLARFTFYFYFIIINSKGKSNKTLK